MMLAAAYCLLGFHTLRADDHGLTLGGETRWRYEALDNQFRRGGAGGDSLLAVRTLVHADWQSKSRFGARIELVDSRTLFDEGSSPLSTSFVNTADILEAHIRYRLDGLLGDGSTGYVRAGRFTRDITSRRFVARNGFRNTINAFTGLDSYLKLDNGQTFSALAAIPVRRQPRDRDSLDRNAQSFDREDDDLLFWGLHHSRPLEALDSRATLELFLYGLHERDDVDGPNTRNRILFTPGFRLVKKGKKARFDYDLDTALQFGEARATTSPSDTEDLDVGAWFTHAEVGYTFDNRWAFRIAGQFDLASGESDLGNDTFGRFDTLFGVRRRDYGNTSAFGPLSRRNLVSAGIRLEVKHDNKRLDGRIVWLANWLESAVDIGSNTRLIDPTGASGRDLGHTFDSRVRYWLIAKKLRLEFGASLFLKGRFAETAPGAPDEGNTVYGYGQITAKF